MFRAWVQLQEFQYREDHLENFTREKMMRKRMYVQTEKYGEREVIITYFMKTTRKGILSIECCCCMEFRSKCDDKREIIKY